MKKLLFPLAAYAALSLSTQAQVYLFEPFNYADTTILVGAPGSTWVTHSPVPPVDGKRLVVNGGAVGIHQADPAIGSMEDANAPLSLGGSPITFKPDGNGINNDNLLYAGFRVTFNALPNNTLGSYFAHLKSTVGSEFYARIGANTSGAAAGKFRLVIANELWSVAAPPTAVPVDLSLGVSYLVVARHNVDTGASTLWVDPVDENSPSVTATDALSFDATGVITAYAIRQGTSSGTTPAGAPGDLVLDQLSVGGSFSAVPEPRAYAAIFGLGLIGFAAWRRYKFA